MTEAEKFNAVIQELGLQRNAMGDRALDLAVRLAEAQAKVKELEERLVALAKGETGDGNVVELPPRA